MTNDYVRQKIKEALAAVGGDRHDAQKLLITWAVRDMQLLLALTKPHLKAIAAGVIEHALRNPDAHHDAGAEHISKKDMDDILKKSAGSALNLDKRKKANIPPPKSTQRQADAMRKLAAAYTKKKGEE